MTRIVCQRRRISAITSRSGSKSRSLARVKAEGRTEAFWRLSSSPAILDCPDVCAQLLPTRPKRKHSSRVGRTVVSLGLACGLDCGMWLAGLAYRSLSPFVDTASIMIRAYRRHLVLTGNRQPFKASEQAMWRKFANDCSYTRHQHVAQVSLCEGVKRFRSVHPSP